MLVKLLRLNIENLNGRIYTENSLHNCMEDLNNRSMGGNVMYGELGFPDNNDVSLNNASHIIKDVHIDGDYVMGDVEILDTPSGRILRECADSMVFRSRAAGRIDQETNEVILQKVYSFDAIPVDEDSFRGLMDEENLKVRFKEDNKLDLIKDYMSYHVRRMSPEYHDIEGDKIKAFEDMMYHKDCHDECLKIMISKNSDDFENVKFLSEMIYHYEELERFEDCGYLQNLFEEYESRI